MTDIEAAWRARIESLVADARRLPGGDVLSAAVDDVVEHIDGLAKKAADDTRAIVTRAVPPDLVDVVTARIVDRLDLVPWVPLTAEGYFGTFGVENVVFDDEGCALPRSDTAGANKVDGARALWVLFGATAQNSLFDLDDRQAEARASGFGRYIPEAASPSFWADVYPRLDLVRASDAFWELRALSMKQHSARVDGLIPPRDREAVSDIVTRLDAHGPRWIGGMARKLFNAHGESAPLVRLVAWFLVEAMRPASLASLASALVLSAAKNAGDAVALDDTALAKLTAEVERALQHAPTTSAAHVGDGLHPHDEALAKQLESIGAEGRAGAAKIRKAPDKSAARWAPHVEAATVTVDVSGEKPEARFPKPYPPSKPLHAAKYLAQALWPDVRRRLERLRNAVAAPGLSSPVLTNLVAISRRGAQRTLFDGDDILDHKGKRVGSIHLTPTIDSEHISIVNLSSKSAALLVRFVLHKSWEQKWIENKPDATRIDIDGGFPGLTKLLGLNGDKAKAEIVKVVEMLNALHIDSPSGQGRVFSSWHEPAKGQRPARLELSVHGPFAPDYVTRELASHRGAAQDKFIVPVPVPQLLPPLVGRNNDHAAQIFLQSLVLRELRHDAEEMAETGSVAIDPKRWNALRDEAGLPVRVLADVLNAYPMGDGERPPFLLSPTAGRYALADDYQKERASILEAAHAMTKGRAGGKAAAAARRNGGRKPKAKP